MAKPTHHQAETAFFRLLTTSGIDLMVQMPVLAASIHRLFPSFSLSMVRVDASAAPQEHYSEHFDEASHQLFASRGDQFASSGDDPAAFGRLLKNPVPYGNLIETSASYQAGATYQHLFQGNGVHHCLDVALRSPSGPLGILGIFRERGAPRFDTGDVARVAEIYAHLVHAFEARPLAAEFDEVEGGLVIVDAKHRIVWASREARSWLDGATTGADRVRLMQHGIVPDSCRALARSFQRSFATRSSRTAPTAAPTLTLPIPGGRLRLRAYALRAELAPDASPEHVGIQLSLEMHRELRVLSALDAAGLPPQQKRIAFRLFRKQPAAAIAKDLGVGVETLRSYRREIYTRLGVAGAEGLRDVLVRRANSISLDLRTHLPKPRAPAD